jgi:hypothetical protein
MSLVARLGNVIAAPGDVFDEVKSAPSSVANWLIPALLLIVIGWTSAWIVFSQDAIRHQISDSIEKGLQKQVEAGRMSEADADRNQAMIMAGSKIGAVVAPIWLGLVTPFWWGLFLWLAGTKAMKGNFPYMKAVEVAGLAAMIAVLTAIVRTLLIIVKGDIFASTSLGLLVKDFDPQNPLHGLLAQADVMTFWLLAVRAVGLARLTRASFAKAAAWVFGIWAGFTGFQLGLSLIGAAIQKAVTPR